MSESLLMPHNVSKYKGLETSILEKHICVYRTSMGTGKTYIGAELVRVHGWKTLVLSPKAVIDSMWRSWAEEYHLPIDTLTYQRFASLPEEMLHKYAEEYGLLICDEAHHVGAHKWSKNLYKLRDLMLERGKYILGLTADTMRYTDKVYTDVAETFFYKNVVQGYTAAQAIDQGILPMFEYIAAMFERYAPEKKDPALLSVIKRQKVEKLEKRLDLSLDNACAIQAILKKHMVPGTHKIILFIEKHKDEKKAIGIMQKSFPEAVYFVLDSNYGNARNLQILSKFESENKTSILVSVDMLNEGMHINGVDTLIMLRRTTIPSVFFQQLGRISSAGKNVSNLKVFDFVGNNSNIIFRDKKGDTRTAIRKINSGIKDPERQIIVSDYYKEPAEIMRQIENLFSDNWTDAEIDILREWYPKEGIKVTERLPVRSVNAVKHKAALLGIKSTKNYWTKEENEILQKYYPEEGPSAAKRLPRRSEAAVIRQANLLHIKTRLWTKEETAILKKWYPKEGSSCASRLPGKNRASVIAKANNMGLSAPDSSWTPVEDNVLRKFYPSEGPQVYKRFPDRTAAACQGRALRLGLKMESYTKEEEIIRKWYPVEGSRVTERLKDRKSRQAVSAYAQRKLGLTYKGKYAAQKYTSKEDEILRKHFPSEGAKVADRLPGRTKDSVWKRAKKLGIKRIS